MKKIISKNIRVRNRKFFTIGKGSIIDDFSYFSPKIKVGNFTHIAANCHIGGGVEHKFEIGNFCSISSGVKIWCERHSPFLRR